MRHDATIVVECDGCGNEETFDLTKLARGTSWDERGVSQDMKRDGWLESVPGVGDLCPDCVEAGVDGEEGELEVRGG